MTKEELRHDSFVSWTAHAAAWIQKNFMLLAVGISVLAVLTVAGVWVRQNQVNGRKQASQLVHRASSAYLSGSYTEGLQTLDQLLSEHPNTSDGKAALYLSGASHLLLSEHDQAIEQFRAYLRQQPNGMYATSASMGLALAFEGRGDLAEAAQAFRELRNELPAGSSYLSQASFGEARVLARMGQFSGAIEPLELLLGSEDPAVKAEAKARIAVLQARQGQTSS
ncbi:MAG TPA: tetratricopeptide repeat protein [Candidatus Krumholzibacteria bacterium]|jgi:TolA-binding protein